MDKNVKKTTDVNEENNVDNKKSDTNATKATIVPTPFFSRKKPPEPVFWEG